MGVFYGSEGGVPRRPNQALLTLIPSQKLKLGKLKAESGELKSEGTTRSLLYFYFLFSTFCFSFPFQLS